MAQGKKTCVDCLARNSARMKQWRQDPSNLNEVVLSDTRASDRSAKRVNDLTLDFVRAVLQRGCHYCGETALRMTLDRIDNALGHTQDNVNPACIRCNYLRRDMPYEAWLCFLPCLRETREKGLFGGWTCGVTGRFAHA